MVRFSLAVTIALCLNCHLQADQNTPQSIDDHATHKQVATIKIQDRRKPLPINAFCLNKSGQIVAACGTGPGEIRIVNDEGEIVRSWAIDVKPEAVNVAVDGSVLVGGQGKLFRFDAEGKELQQTDSPHVAALTEGTEALRKEAISILTRSTNSLGARITMYERMITQLETKAKTSELNDQEERMLEVLPKTLEIFKKQAAAQPEDENENKGPTEDAIQSQVRNLIQSKMKISSISSDADHVFVATRALAGYGYSVWKMNSEFSEGTVIVQGLSGCCGQMDVQCCQNGLFVAENSRHRVVRYDANGEQAKSWGKRDRTGVDGFSSCCNPMNVCFNAANEVFTAESGTGRIKRYNSDGKFIAYVGDVDLVPGCKNVSIAVSPDSDKVYMLDLTRNHIVMMKTRTSEPAPAESAKATEAGE